MMTVYESFAHVLINEHARDLMLGRNAYSTDVHGFRSRIWRWLLIAYGSKLYTLPHQLGLPISPSAATRKNPFNFPVFSIPKMMMNGIAPSSAMSDYLTATGHHHQHTPLHIGTALVKHGNAEDIVEVRKLFSLDFLKEVYKDHAPTTFASHMYLNPYKPADVGAKPFDIEALFTTPMRTPCILDELGNAAWFPPQFLKGVLSSTGHVNWYTALCQLNAVHGLWTELVQGAASQLLSASGSGVKVDYKNSTDYLRNAKPEVARRYLDGLKGVRQALSVVRWDATPEEMARGLATIVTNQNVRTEDLFKYYGRALVIDDFRKLTPNQALSVLYYSNFDTVKDVINEHNNELASMFFTLTGPKTLPLVTNSMSPHSSRPAAWYPDVVDHELSQKNYTKDAPKPTTTVKERWNASMRPLIEAYDTAKDWRDEFIQLAPPEVLFLSLTRWAGRAADDPVPDAAIDSILRSYPNITEIQNVIGAMPKAVVGLQGL